MTRFKKAAAVIIAALITLLSAGCNDTYQDAIIYFEIPERPSTLDPQTASTDSELSVVANIYEGLLRKNASGAIVCGICESFSVEGLTYTFKLRDDAVWSNEEPVTSADFLFAFRRAVSPQTKAPFVSRLFSIQNAQDIYNGKASADTLGVSAPDDTTFIIKLAYADEDFEETLTTSVAMPCNEKFFTESAGKYGLTAEHTLSCGSYELTKWNRESKTFGIRLYANDLYTGTFTAKNSAVYITKDEEETAMQRLSDNNVDIAFIDSSLSDTAEQSGLKTVNYQNICWFLTISQEFSQNMRKAFGMLTGGEVYGANLPCGYTVATSVFPSEICDNADSSGMTPYDLQNGKKLFSSETDKLEDKKFPSGVKLYYYDSSGIKSVVTDIVGHWQNNLGAFVNIEATTNYETMIAELKEQTLTMAIFPLRAGSGNTAEYLANFGIDYKGGSLSEIQSQILKSNNIYPIAFQNTTIAYSKALNDVFTNPGNGYIDFSFIVKTE